MGRKLNRYQRAREREKIQAQRKAEAKHVALGAARAGLTKLLAIAQKDKWTPEEQHEISSSLFNIDSIVSGYCNRQRR